MKGIGEEKKFYIEGNIDRFGPSGNKNPGVGEYDINDAEIKLKKKTGISNVKSQRKDPFEVSKESKNVPGTGAYNINKGEEKKFYIEGNMERFGPSGNKNPGVGEYDINDAELKLKKKTGISTIKQVRKDPFEVSKESKNIPGAGAYNINKNEEQKFYIEQNIERFGSSGNKNPGVGEYNINEAELNLKKKTGISTNKSKRKDPFEVTKESKNVPGTGAYNISKAENSKFYIDKDVPRFVTSDNGKPGVGEYDINEAELNLKKKTAYNSKVKSVRKDPFEATKESKNVPGTGAYNIDKKEQKGVYIEGKIERFDSSNNGKPGVGEYDINEAELKLKKKTGISTVKQVRKDPFEATKESKNVPGTGAYNISKNEQQNFYIEKNIERFGSSGNKNPGVGEYDINEAELKLKKKTGISIIKAIRIDENVPRFTSSDNGKPGVGEYNINEAELKLKKKTGISTVKQVRKDPFEATKESKNVPGTGAYNVIKVEQQKFYIEPNIERFGPSGNQIPGVGEYNHSPIEIKLKPKEPEYSEPQAERKMLFENKENNEKVGPGTYEVKNEISKAGQQKFSTLPRKL